MVASRTVNFSVGIRKFPVDNSVNLVKFIHKMLLVVKSPQVIIISASRDFAAAILSYTTAAGSAPSLCFTILTPVRLPIYRWSIAAARKVSAAPSKTFLPSFLYLAASFPMLVVLPTPFTPIMQYGWFCDKT